MFTVCPRKIRDKSQSDKNEFLKCHLEKVSTSSVREVESTKYGTRLVVFGFGLTAEPLTGV